MQTPPPLASSTRPRSLTVAAVISIVFGVFGLLGIIPALMALAGIQFGEQDPMTAAMLADPVIQAFQKTGGLIGAAAGALLLAAGISLLKCREWARKVIIGWSLYSILAAMAGTWVTMTHIVPLMEKTLTEQMKDLGQGAAMGVKFGVGAASAGAVGGLIFSLGLAITLIVMVTRPRAKAACQGASA